MPLNPDSILPPLYILTATAKAHLGIDKLEHELSSLNPISPSTWVGLDETWPSEIQSKNALAYGKCLHRLLELSIGSTPHLQSLKEIVRWMRHRIEEGKLLSLIELEEIATLAIQNAKQCMSSPAWQTIFEQAVHIYQEFGLAHIVSTPQGQGIASGLESLIIGQPDLVIEKNNSEIWVVDYKTGFIQSNTDPLLYCQQRGYDIQVQTYALSLQRIYPSRIIKQWIFLTQTATLVEIPSTHV